MKRQSVLQNIKRREANATRAVNLWIKKLKEKGKVYESSN